jgi:hypothetical protein
MTDSTRSEIDPRRASAYVPLVLEQIPRLLGTLDREPQSLSFGSFDRTHWAWKFSDFPILMAQIAVYPLALLWRYPFQDNPYHQNAQVLTWIHGAVDYVCRRQRANGSFDSVGPYTQDHGNTLFMTYLMTQVHRELGTSLDTSLHERIGRAVEAAGDFALRSTEDYAFISNHQALYALALHDAARLTGQSRFDTRARANIDTILRKQSADGWYEEYGGPDPGYETLGLFYLAKYWQRTGDAGLLDSLRRSVEFLSHFVHPDGSIGGSYGSRNTSLYMPGGFEILASQIPVAGAIADFVRDRLSRANVVTLASTDAQNLGVLAYTYLEACLAPSVPRGSERLPHQTLDGTRRFPHSGLVVAGNAAYYAVVNTHKGGVCRIFDKGKERVAYEDAGYVAEIRGRRYVSQLSGLSRDGASDSTDAAVSEATFGEVRQVLPTPIHWIALRILNLTVFRSLSLGAWVRRRILARLILARRPGPLKLTRSITFSAREVRVQDRLTSIRGTRVDRLDLARSFSAIHMGSAKYFHASALEDVLQPPLANAADRLSRHGEADVSFAVLVTPGPR